MIKPGFDSAKSPWAIEITLGERPKWLEVAARE
jgi:hypothetical protein